MQASKNYMQELQEEGFIEKGKRRGVSKSECEKYDRVWSPGNHLCTEICLNDKIHQFYPDYNRCLAKESVKEAIDDLIMDEGHFDEACACGSRFDTVGIECVETEETNKCVKRKKKTKTKTKKKQKKRRIVKSNLPTLIKDCEDLRRKFDM